MKILLISLILWLPILAARGQTLPIAVDNSRYFPPVIDQQGPSCSHVALIYYLKSAIWNRQFNRDPKLPENQFSYGFVWNQNVFPDFQTSFQQHAAYFMQDQGCATVADYPLGINVNNPVIGHSIREKALNYKTGVLSALSFNNMHNDTEIARKNFIQSLKDSLVSGKCFVIDFQLFSYFFNMKGTSKIYNKYSGMSFDDSLKIKHVVAVVGYDDTIKTAEGRGAFKAINSSKEIDFFYLDYQWFLVPYNDGFYDSFTCMFLEEDFSASSETVAINLEISGAVTSQQVMDYKFSLVPSAMTQTIKDGFGEMFWPNGQQVDYLNYFSYLWRRNYVQMISYNNQKIPLRQEEFLFPMNHPNGHYYLIKDVSHLGSPGQLKTASVVVFDPISVKYVADNGATIYSYTRTSNIKVEKAFVSLIDSGKKIYAKVVDLPDTTIVVTNFYSWSAGAHLVPQQNWVHVKSCTSTVKRKLVTFSVDYVDTPPVFTAVPVNNLIEGEVGTSIKFQFAASDSENQPISFSIVQGQGAVISSSSGLFSLSPTAAGDYSYTVRVSDGINHSDYSFTVKASINQPPVFTSVPLENALNVQAPYDVSFQFVAVDPEGKAVTYSIVTGDGLGTLNSNGQFHYKSQEYGSYRFVIRVSDGKYSTDYEFYVYVSRANRPPRFENILGGGVIKLKETLTFTFTASDPDGQVITFSLAAGSLGTINSATGEFSFTGTELGIFPITVVISDGVAMVEYSFSIQVDVLDSVDGIEDSGFKLLVYPNPVSNQMNLEFSLPTSGDVSIEIIDISGKIVGAYVHEFYGLGVNTLRQDASYLKTGVYICRLKSGNLVRTFKFVKR